MPKTRREKRMLVYSGALVKPLFRYLLKMDLVVSQRDPNGSDIALNFWRQHSQQPSRNYQPIFETSLVSDSRLDSSSMYIKFLTGWEHKYQLRYSNYKTVTHQIEMYNYMIEGIRNAQGHDDEPEEESRILRLGDKIFRKFERPKRPKW